MASPHFLIFLFFIFEGWSMSGNPRILFTCRKFFASCYDVTFEAGCHMKFNQLSWTNQLSSVSLLPVPTPRVDVSHHPNTDTLYAGSRLNLTCVITLNSVLSPFLGDLIVTSVWTKLRGMLLSSNDGGRIVIFPISQLGSTTTYSSTMMFKTLQMSDTGNYTCEVTVAHIMSPVRNVMNGTNSSTTTIRVQGKKTFSFC